jgi:hypothetical protein
VLRRPGWAFTAGVPIFAFTRLAIQQWVRPTLITPTTLTNTSGFSFNLTTNNWVLHEGILPTGVTDPASSQTWTATPPKALQACVSAGKDQASPNCNAFQAHCAQPAHVHFVIQFQPDSRYWALQGAETGIFVAMAVLLIAVTTIAVRKQAA